MHSNARLPDIGAPCSAVPSCVVRQRVRRKKRVAGRRCRETKSQQQRYPNVYHDLPFQALSLCSACYNDAAVRSKVMGAFHVGMRETVLICGAPLSKGQLDLSGAKNKHTHTAHHVAWTEEHVHSRRTSRNTGHCYTACSTPRNRGALTDRARDIREESTRPVNGVCLTFWAPLFLYFSSSIVGKEGGDGGHRARRAQKEHRCRAGRGGTREVDWAKLSIASLCRVAAMVLTRRRATVCVVVGAMFSSAKPGEGFTPSGCFGE